MQSHPLLTSWPIVRRPCSLPLLPFAEQQQSTAPQRHERLQPPAVHRDVTLRDDALDALETHALIARGERRPGHLETSGSSRCAWHGGGGSWGRRREPGRLCQREHDRLAVLAPASAAPLPMAPPWIVARPEPACRHRHAASNRSHRGRDAGEPFLRQLPRDARQRRWIHARRSRPAEEHEPGPLRRVLSAPSARRIPCRRATSRSPGTPAICSTQAAAITGSSGPKAAATGRWRTTRGGNPLLLLASPHLPHLRPLLLLSLGPDIPEPPLSAGRNGLWADRHGGLLRSRGSRPMGRSSTGWTRTTSVGRATPPMSPFCT